MSDAYDKDKITQILDDVLASKGHMIRCQSAAAQCQTREDWVKLHVAQDQFELAHEHAVQEILQMLAHARRG